MPKKGVILSRARNNRIYAIPNESHNCHRGSFCEEELINNESQVSVVQFLQTRNVEKVVEVGSVQQPEIITKSPTPQILAASTSSALPLTPLSASEDEEEKQEEEEGKLITAESKEIALSNLWDGTIGNTGTAKRRPTLLQQQTEATTNVFSMVETPNNQTLSTQSSCLVKQTINAPTSLSPNRNCNLKVNSSTSSQNDLDSCAPFISANVERKLPPSLSPPPHFQKNDPSQHFSVSEIPPPRTSNESESGKDFSERNMSGILTRQEESLTRVKKKASSLPTPTPGGNGSRPALSPGGNHSSVKRFVCNSNNPFSEASGGGKGQPRFPSQQASPSSSLPKPSRPSLLPLTKAKGGVVGKVELKKVGDVLMDPTKKNIRHNIQTEKYSNQMHSFQQPSVPHQINEKACLEKAVGKKSDVAPAFLPQPNRLVKESGKGDTAGDSDGLNDKANDISAFSSFVEKNEDPTTIIAVGVDGRRENGSNTEKSTAISANERRNGDGRVGTQDTMGEGKGSESERTIPKFITTSHDETKYINGFLLSLPSAIISNNSTASNATTRLRTSSGNASSLNGPFTAVFDSNLVKEKSEGKEILENKETSNNGIPFNSRNDILLPMNKYKFVKCDSCPQLNSSKLKDAEKTSEVAEILLEFLNDEGGHAHKIYTDWANYYLEKARSKRHIQDLQVDVTDGVILADVIEAVASKKIPEIKRKPKTSSDMLDNIQGCLVFLTNLGVSLEGINARDIRDGHLKSILSLFFQLSRYKQQQKQQDRDRHNLQRQLGEGNMSSMMQASGIKNPTVTTNNSSKETVSKLPSAYSLKTHQQQTSIPLPSSIGQSNAIYPSTTPANFTPNGVGNSKRLSHEKGKIPLTVGHQHHPYSAPSGNVPVAVKPASGSSSRSTSPSAGGLSHSFIPTPRSSIPSAPTTPGSRSSLHEKHLNNAKNSSIAGPPPSTNKSSVRPHQPQQGNLNVHSSSTSFNSNGTAGQPASVNGKSSNTSMLEKFKFFKDKDKQGDKGKASAGSKRTSSSSGFSSARSERSDSSVSICSDGKRGSVEGSSGSRGGGVIYHEKDKERDHSGGNNGSIIPQSSVVGPNPSATVVDPSLLSNGGEITSTPRLAIKGFRQKIGKAIASKESKGSHHHSPKSSKTETIQPTPANPALHSKGLQPSNSENVNSGKKSSDFSSQVCAKSSKGGRGTVLSDPIVQSQTNNCGVTPISGGVGSQTASGSQSFLRHPKLPVSATGGRDSRNRFSGTGIPTRNSLIVSNRDDIQNHPSNKISSSGSVGADIHHPHYSSNHDNGSNASASIHSSMSSINGTTPSSGVGTCSSGSINPVSTSIPKPMAAIKGTSKQNEEMGCQQQQSQEAAEEDEEETEHLVTVCQNVDNRISRKDNNSSFSESQCSSKGQNNNNPPKLIASNPASTSLQPEVLQIREDDATTSNDDTNAVIPKQNQRPSLGKVSSSNSAGGGSGKTGDNSANNLGGVTIAMVAPMPSLSNSASISSVDSSSHSLSQSQLSSVSQSNSSEASVILAKGHLQFSQQQCSSEYPSKPSMGAKRAALKETEIETSSTKSTPLINNSGVGSDRRELTIDNSNQNQVSNSSAKVSPMSVFGSSGSSSMGSIKCAAESTSSGASSSGELGSNGELSTARSHTSNLSPNNGNDVIPECDEDDLLLNVTPMEPMTYEYVKSPPSRHSHQHMQGFLSPKSSALGTGFQLGRIGQSINGNSYTGRILNRHFNPYHDYSNEGKEGESNSHYYGRRHYAASLGENEYSEIDNYDLNAAGYLSDGDLLTTGSGGGYRPHNDGYLSESGTSNYSRRQGHQTQNYKKDAFACRKRNVMQPIQTSHRQGFIPEDSFDDSSSISSGISDLNEIPTDLTSSSVNSELSSPYASLQRGGGGGESSNKGSEPISKQIDPQSIIYRVVGSRHRRSDSKSRESNSSVNQSSSKLKEGVASTAAVSGGLCDSSSSTITHGDSQSSGISFRGAQKVESNGIIKSGHPGWSSGDHHHQQQQSSKGGSSKYPRQQHGGSSSNVSSPHHHPLGTGANNEIQSVVYSLSQQHLSSSSSTKRSVNSLDPKAKKGGGGMIGGLREDYGREIGMGECLIKDRDQYPNGPNGSGSGSSSNMTMVMANSPQMMDGKRISVGTTTKISQNSGGGVNPNFGYVRRSTGCGVGGSSHSVSNTKYSIPIYGNGKGALTAGMKEMLSAEEFKAAHAALAMAAGGSLHNPPPQHHGPYSPVPVNPSSMSGVMASPRTRTKVKVSGGTQTTNDLHELSTSGRQSSLSHHYSTGLIAGSPQRRSINSSSALESEYAASVISSRNSGSYSTSSRYDGGGGGGSVTGDIGTSSTLAAYKSLSLTTPTATQLSQNLRERILGSHSLPKGATAADYAALLAAIQQQHQIYGTPNASKEKMARYLSCKAMNDGALNNDAGGGYSNYNELQTYATAGGGHGQHGTATSMGSGIGQYNSWMRHSTGYASSVTSAPMRLKTSAGGNMTEAESMESLNSSISLTHNARDIRSNTLNQVRSSINTNGRDTSPSQSPRLNRSNSIRSTKSEKLYPSMLQRHEEINNHLQYFNPQASVGLEGLQLSPLHGASLRMGGGGNHSEASYSSAPANTQNVRLSMSPYTGFVGKVPTKEDEINASSLSLVSSSSIYSSQEDKQAHEVRKFKRELMEAHEKVQTLTNQLSTNAHVVAAFEQSLSNMTQRIQNLTCSSEQKDSELLELRQTIELLRKHSIEAGLTVASLNAAGITLDGSCIARQLSADSVSSINSISSACSCTSHSHTSSPSGHVQTTPLGTPTHSHGPSSIPDSPGLKKKHAKNKGWLRSSFTKAFSRSKSKARGEGMMMAEGDLECRNDPNGDSTQSLLLRNGHLHKQPCPKTARTSQNLRMPGSPLLSPPQSNGCSSSSGSHSPRSNSGTNPSSGVCEDFGDEPKSVDDLKKQLREKEMVLTDIRLEALTSAHQLESLKETVNKMRNEMLSLKQDNERLQRMVTCRSLTSSQSSLQIMTSDSMDRRLSASEVPPPSSANLDVILCESTEKEGKRIVVTVFLGSHGSYERYTSVYPEGFPVQECNIGTVSVSSKTKWDVLDALIKRVFKEYLARIDPISSLGLTADSIISYNVGEVLRSKEGYLPDLLPCGYLVGDVMKIRVCLKGAIQNSALDALAFETLVPKSILQRYINLLSDSGRIILSGPSGTGKSYLARKIGEYLVARCGKDPCTEAIATFSADHKNSKELRQYLTNLVEQYEGGSSDLPSVIILDNLHQVSSFGEVFSGYLNSNENFGPIVIGTMTQSTASTPNLQLHHNFRWVLFGNHLEPVKGLLSRYLQRRLIDVDVQNGNKNVELARVMDWIPKVWSHINKFLEIHNSSDVTFGPRLFLSCPTDLANSQVWFTDLWHYSIIPYVIEAVKEGVQLYGTKASWEDPCHYLLQSYPWSDSHSLSCGKASLLRLRPEDVGYDTNDMSSPKTAKSDSTKEQDPLMNMLMRLQEAANYSGPQSNEPDVASTVDPRTNVQKDYVLTT